MCDGARTNALLRNQSEDPGVGRAGHARGLMGPMVTVWPVSGSRIVMGTAPPARSCDGTGSVAFGSNRSDPRGNPPAR